MGVETGRAFEHDADGANGRSIPPRASIRIVAGFYEGLEWPIDCDWIVVGRGRAADLALADPVLSRAHAGIGFDGEGFFVQDLGSTNGTFVNGARCDRAQVRDGDEIRMGKLGLRVQVRT